MQISISSLQTYIFFFSSRRGHTRSDRDWSSDVCSSDLVESAERRDEAEAPGSVGLPGEVADDLDQVLVALATVDQRAPESLFEVERAQEDEYVSRLRGQQCRLHWYVRTVGEHDDGSVGGGTYPLSRGHELGPLPARAQRLDKRRRAGHQRTRATPVERDYGTGISAHRRQR